jgi:hypothetical protein
MQAGESAAHAASSESVPDRRTSKWQRNLYPQFPRSASSCVSNALNIPLRERNVLLLASGFAPQFSEQSIDAEQMAIVTRAIDRMLRQHEPHPALVLDRYWNVIRTNEAAPRFFGSFVDLEKRPKPRNLLDLMFDPTGMRPSLRSGKRSRPVCCKGCGGKQWDRYWIRNSRSC